MKKLLVIIAIAIASSVVASAQTKKTAKEENLISIKECNMLSSLVVGCIHAWQSRMPMLRTNLIHQKKRRFI